MTAAGDGPLVIGDARADPRVHAPPPVTSGQVGTYLGVPLSGRDGRVIGVLCMFGPEPRPWSGADVATLVELADAVVTELEHVALRRQYEGDRLRLAAGDRLRRHRRLRLGPGHRPADLGPPAHRRCSATTRPTSTRASRRSTPACTPTTCPASARRCRTASRPAASTRPSTGWSVPTARSAGCTHAAEPSRGRTAPPSACWVPPTTPLATVPPRPASRGCSRPCRPASTASTASGASPTSTPRPSACSAVRARTCSAACSGTNGPRPSTASSRTATAPPRAPASRSPSTPTTPRRSTAGTSCAPGRAPTASRSTSWKSPSAGACRSRPRTPPGGWPCSPGSAPSSPARWTRRRRRPISRAWWSRRWRTSASSP